MLTCGTLDWFGWLSEGLGDFLMDGSQVLLMIRTGTVSVSLETVAPSQTGNDSDHDLSLVIMK